MACVSPKVQLVIGGLWKIYNRWAVFEGYVFSNYLCAEGFDCVVAQATCSLHHPGPVAGLPAIFYHMRRIEFWINDAWRLWSDVKGYIFKEEKKLNVWIVISDHSGLQWSSRACKMAHLALCLQPPAKCEALSDLPRFEWDINIPFPPGRGIL